MGAVSVVPLKSRAAIGPFEAFVEAAAAVVPVDEAVLITTMPRGGLQVCRSLHLSEPAVRRYGVDAHRTDRVVWNALLHGFTGPDDDRAAPRPDHPLTRGYAVSLAVRVEGPVFGGYPGVVLLLRRPTSRPVEADADSQGAMADRVRTLFARFLSVRTGAASRQFVFVDGRQVLPDRGDESVVARGVAVLAKAAFGHPESPDTRDAVTDEHGLRAPVHLVRFDTYPALGDGPVVFASVHPRVEDWDALRPDAFAADPELGRMAEAVRFITAHFRRGPTLDEVAEAVHLSQFHFHRRFSDLFGLTPKHLLYDLQLDEARRLLADPRQALASIAKHCGFAHQSHFTSRFKQGTGLTPTRWRRQATAEAAETRQAAAV